MHTQPLQLALLANAAFSTLTGAAALLFSGPLQAALGIGPGWLLPVLGVGLLVFAVDLVRAARRPRARYALWISTQDAAWVLGSAAILVFAPGWLSEVGRHVVLAVAVVVGALGLAQLSGIARLFRGADGGSELEASRVYDVDPDAAWSAVSELERYADIAPNLSFARLMSPPAIGAVRTCGDPAGHTWTEELTEWTPGRAYAVRVRTEAADYPYPFRALAGRWSVEPNDGGARVTMRFRATMPAGPLGEILFAVSVAPRFGPVLDAIFDGWGEWMRAPQAARAA